MNVLSWFLDEKKEQPTPKFVPKIVINPKSTLYVEVQPNDPTNCSNIAITAFASQQNRQIVPIRVQWSRFKVKSQTTHSVQKIHCLVGNTYMCEPGDVGGYIKALVRSVDQTIRAQAEVTIGPIGIDVMMKRLIEGALYSGSLLSQVVVIEKDRKNNVSLRLTTRTMQFVDENSEEKLVKDFTMSQPKIQLNPKDSTRVYLRFQQDQTNSVRQWLNNIYNVRNASIDESSLSSVKVPYASHSQSSSKLRLFQKTQSHCINKLEMRFISRNSRDLFLFTQRAFICRQDMKNSIYLQRIETLQTIATEEDYYRFLGFLTLKNEILRLADFAKQIEDDRNAKVKDLITMEESIGDMTLTYLKIIEEKGKGQNLNLSQSYSQISNTREDVLNRKNVRELKNQNESLKQRLREMNQEIELLKFFKKEDNESMIFNQTSNPFAKKNNDVSVSYQINAVSPQTNKAQRKNMFEMSVNYTKLLEENNQLKKQVMSNNKKQKVSKNLDRSQNIMEMLGDLDEKEENQQKIVQYQKKFEALIAQNEQFKRKINELLSSNQGNQGRNTGLNVMSSNRSIPNQEQSLINIINNSMLNQSGSSSSVSQSFINQSITSEAAVMKLQENLRHLDKMNTKLQEDTTRLRRQRDYYRNEAAKLNEQLKKMQSNNKMDKSNFINPNDNSVLYRIKEENESLQNERKGLMKKLQSLSKENASGLREEFLQKEKKLKQYEQIVDRLKLQNIAFSKQLSQIGPRAEQSQFFINENIKLKKINSELLQEIKSLKIQLEIRGDNLYNSRIIEMQNELDMVKGTPSNEGNNDRKLIEQINDLTKNNTKLKQQNKDKQTKLDHQTVTIQKLMRETAKREHSPKQKHNSSSSSTKEKAYSEKCSQATVEQIEKYKREVKKLQEEIIFMKKSSDAINRSRDLTLEMDSYHEQKMQIMKKELEALYVQNENLSKMCQRYGKDARDAHKELNKWREKAMDLMKAKTDQSSLIV